MRKYSKWILCFVCLFLVASLCLGLNVIKTYIVSIHSSSSTPEETFQKSIPGSITIIDSIASDDVAYMIGCKRAEIIDRCLYNDGKSWHIAGSSEKMIATKTTGPIDIVCSEVNNKFIIRIIQFPLSEKYDLATDSLQSDFHFTKYKLETDETRYAIIQSTVLENLPENYTIIFRGEKIPIN